LFSRGGSTFSGNSGSRSNSGSGSGGHHIAGQNVSQLQAVLARRCSSIGELQQHLWRAGWQSGVAQWGILGQGSEFAPVIGGHSDIIDEQSQYYQSSASAPTSMGDSKGSFFGSIRRDRKKNKDGRVRRNDSSDYYVDSLLYVRNQKGGAIIKNDSALAAWSIDAIRVVRDQLYNAGSGIAPLPNYENWPREKKHFHKNDVEHTHEKRQRPTLGDSMMSMDGTHIFDDEKSQENELPLWATVVRNCIRNKFYLYHQYSTTDCLTYLYSPIFVCTLLNF
jgi:hypothetical protein